MKKAAKWILLIVAVIAVIGTCGSANQIRTEYDVFQEATSAAKRRDWSTFVALMHDNSGRNPAPKEIQQAFLETYIDPIAASEEAKIKTEMSPSRLVPIPNHLTTLTAKGSKDVLFFVTYEDMVEDFRVPFVKTRFEIFKGKRVRWRMEACLRTLARRAFPIRKDRTTFGSMALFIRQEAEKFRQLGIEPKHFRRMGTWEELANAMERLDVRVRAYNKTGPDFPPAKSSRRTL